MGEAGNDVQLVSDDLGPAAEVSRTGMGLSCILAPDGSEGVELPESSGFRSSVGTVVAGFFCVCWLLFPHCRYFRDHYPNNRLPSNPCLRVLC